MTETSEKKTKRDFCRFLNEKEWVRQVSIFYNSREYFDKGSFFKESTAIRSKLARSYPSCSFLWRLALKYKNSKDIKLWQDTKPYKGAMPYWTVFITEDIPKLRFEELVKLALSKTQSCDLVKVKYKSVTKDRLEGYVSAVKSQRPHNLKGVFGDMKINRIHRNHW